MYHKTYYAINTCLVLNAPAGGSGQAAKAARRSGGGGGGGEGREAQGRVAQAPCVRQDAAA